MWPMWATLWAPLRLTPHGDVYGRLGLGLAGAQQVEELWARYDNFAGDGLAGKNADYDIKRYADAAVFADDLTKIVTKAAKEKRE